MIPRPRPQRPAATVDAPINPLEALVDLIAERVAERVAAVLTPKPEPEPEYMSRQLAARYLDISLTTLDILCREENLPYVIIGDTRRFRKAPLDAWVTERSRLRRAGEVMHDRPQ